MYSEVVQVDEALVAPIINCNEQTNDITFTWNGVANSTGYEVIVNNVSQGIQAGTSFFVDGLVPGNMVELVVIALSSNKCEDV